MILKVFSNLNDSMKSYFLTQHSLHGRSNQHHQWSLWYNSLCRTHLKRRDESLWKYSFLSADCEFPRGNSWAINCRHLKLNEMKLTQQHLLYQRAFLTRPIHDGHLCSNYSLQLPHPLKCLKMEQEKGCQQEQFMNVFWDLLRTTCLKKKRPP